MKAQSRTTRQSQQPGNCSSEIVRRSSEHHNCNRRTIRHDPPRRTLSTLLGRHCPGLCFLFPLLADPGWSDPAQVPIGAVWCHHGQKHDENQGVVGCASPQGHVTLDLSVLQHSSSLGLITPGAGGPKDVDLRRTSQAGQASCAARSQLPLYMLSSR